MNDQKSDNGLVIALVVLIAVFLFGGFGIMGFGGMGNMMGWNNNYNGIGFMWGFGWIFMILFWVALVLFILWIVKQIQNSGGRR